MDRRIEFKGSELETWMKDWRKNHNITEPSLTIEETKLFVTELYEKIEGFGYYNLPDGAEIILYSRDIMGTGAWEVAHGVSQNSEKSFLQVR